MGGKAKQQGYPKTPLSYYSTTKTQKSVYLLPWMVNEKINKKSYACNLGYGLKGTGAEEGMLQPSGVLHHASKRSDRHLSPLSRELVGRVEYSAVW